MQGNMDGEEGEGRERGWGRREGGTHEVDGPAGQEALVCGVELFLSSKVPATDVVGLRITQVTRHKSDRKSYRHILYYAIIRC